jgi:hypothetical protein
MTKTAANVRVGVVGEVHYDGLDGTEPTSATAALTGFVGLGYVSEGGVTQSISGSTTNLVAWGGDTVRTVSTEHNATFSFVLIETSAEVLKTYYGDDTATASAAKITAAQGRRGMWVIDVLDGDYTIRLVLPDAQVTTTGDVVYATGELIGYPITLTAYPDTSEVKAYIYIDDGEA